MSEGKYVDEVYKQVCKLPDDDPNALADLIHIANVVAVMHPVWYERFRIWSAFVRGWRWVISKTCSVTSGRSDGRSAP